MAKFRGVDKSGIGDGGARFIAQGGQARASGLLALGQGIARGLSILNQKEERAKDRKFQASREDKRLALSLERETRSQDRIDARQRRAEMSRMRRDSLDRVSDLDDQIAKLESSRQGLSGIAGVAGDDPRLTQILQGQGQRLDSQLERLKQRRAGVVQMFNKQFPASALKAGETLEPMAPAEIKAQPLPGRPTKTLGDLQKCIGDECSVPEAFTPPAAKTLDDEIRGNEKSLALMQLAAKQGHIAPEQLPILIGHGAELKARNHTLRKQQKAQRDRREKLGEFKAFADNARLGDLSPEEQALVDEPGVSAEQAFNQIISRREQDAKASKRGQQAGVALGQAFSASLGNILPPDPSPEDQARARGRLSAEQTDARKDRLDELGRGDPSPHIRIGRRAIEKANRQLLEFGGFDEDSPGGFTPEEFDAARRLLSENPKAAGPEVTQFFGAQSAPAETQAEPSSEPAPQEDSQLRQDALSFPESGKAVESMEKKLKRRLTDAEIRVLLRERGILG